MKIKRRVKRLFCLPNRLEADKLIVRSGTPQGLVGDARVAEICRFEKDSERIPPTLASPTRSVSAALS